MIKVSGKENLVKNENGSVMNINSSSYKKAKAAKQKVVQEMKERNIMLHRIESLEKRITELEERFK